MAEAHPEVAGALAALDREVGFAMPKGAPRLRRGRVRLLEMESRLRMKRLRNQVDIWEGRDGVVGWGACVETCWAGAVVCAYEIEMTVW